MLANNWTLNRDYNINYSFSLKFDRRHNDKMGPFLENPQLLSGSKPPEYHSLWKMNQFVKREPEK